MVGDYNDDSSSEENFNLLLHLTWVEANVDLKRQGARVLEGCLQEQGVSGASTMTPSNNQLLRKFKHEGTRKRILKSNMKI